MKTSHVFSVVLFVCGVAAGYCYRVAKADSANDADVVASGAEVEPPAPPVVEPSSENRIAAMRRRVDELESKIAARPGDDDKAQVETPAVGSGQVDLGAHRLEYILRLQAEDPRQFARLTNDMVRGSRWQKQQAQVRFDYFSRADVTKMSDDERAVHEELLACQEAIGRIGEIGGIWDRSAEVENARREERNEIESRIVDLYQREARTLLRLKALRLGYAEDDAEEIAESVSELLKATYNSTEYIGKAD